jgi:hypothetical protein
MQGTEHDIAFFLALGSAFDSHIKKDEVPSSSTSLVPPRGLGDRAVEQAACAKCFLVM